MARSKKWLDEMCKHGTTVDIWITLIPNKRYGEPHKKLCKIDACISTIVSALENGGIVMENSCCGHGETDGTIFLKDGRTLVIKR